MAARTNLRLVKHRRGLQNHAAKPLSPTVLGAVAVGGGIIGFSGLYVGRWEVALIGGLVALLLGVVFKGVYSRYMRSLGAESA